jgi:hypothetical protein
LKLVTKTVIYKLWNIYQIKEVDLRLKQLRKLLSVALAIGVLLGAVIWHPVTSYAQKQSEEEFFENLPIMIAEGVSLEELAEKLNEPRILKSKNVTIVKKDEMPKLAGTTKKVYGKKKDKQDSQIDVVVKSEGVEPQYLKWITFDHHMSSDFGDGEVYSHLTVSSVSGAAAVRFNHMIKQSYYENGSYSIYSSIAGSFTAPRVGDTHTHRAPADTYWWSGDISGTVTWSDGKTSSINPINGPEKILTNSVGDIYPDYEDPQSYIELIKPPANLVKKKREREPKYRDKFIEYYEKYWGKPQYFKWEEVEIHHMIPLEYYGTNDVDNLIPLLKSGYYNDYIMYHKEVTDWWRYY